MAMLFRHLTLGSADPPQYRGLTLVVSFDLDLCEVFMSY